MTDCKQVQPQLQAYLDGELAAAERQGVAAHLAACPACRRLAAAYERLFAALDEPELAGPSPGFARRVMQRVAAAQVRRRRLQAWVLAAAVLLASCIGALWASPQVPAVGWSDVTELGRLDLWGTISETFTQLRAAVAAESTPWLPMMPVGPVVILVLVAFVCVDVLLAYRWRALARLNGGQQGRPVR